MKRGETRVAPGSGELSPEAEEIVKDASQRGRESAARIKANNQRRSDSLSPPIPDKEQVGKFRKKQVTVEAILWTGDNIEEIHAFMAPHKPEYMAGFSNAEDLVSLLRGDGSSEHVIRELEEIADTLSKLPQRAITDYDEIQAVHDRAEKAEQELEQVREEVERVRKHHEDDLAVAAKRLAGLTQQLSQVREEVENIKAILDSSPSLSGGGESSGVGLGRRWTIHLIDRGNGVAPWSGVRGPATNPPEDRNLSGIEWVKASEVEVIPASILDGLEDRIAVELRRVVALEDEDGPVEDSHYDEVARNVVASLTLTQPVPGTTNTSLSGDVERPCAFGFVDITDRIRGPLPAGYEIPQQSSTTGNSPGGIARLRERIEVALGDPSEGFTEDARDDFLRIFDEAAGTGNSLSGEPGGREGFEHCKRCGRGNTLWFAPSPLWNAVMRGGSINGDPIYDDLVCATCFMEIAEEAGIASVFKVYAERVNVELETTTPSGRVWNEEQGVWIDPAAASTQPEDTHLSGDGERLEEIAAGIESATEGLPPRLGGNSAKRDAAFLRDRAKVENRTFELVASLAQLREDLRSGSKGHVGATASAENHFADRLQAILDKCAPNRSPENSSGVEEGDLQLARERGREALISRLEDALLAVCAGWEGGPLDEALDALDKDNTAAVRERLESAVEDLFGRELLVNRRGICDEVETALTKDGEEFVKTALIAAALTQPVSPQPDPTTRPRFSDEERELLGVAANIVERAAAMHLANFLRKLATPEDCERCKGSGVELRQGCGEWESDPCPVCAGSGVRPSEASGHA